MENKWFYAENRQQKGPVSSDELKALLASGNLQAATLVWHAGMTTWQAAANVPELWETRNQEGPENLPEIDPLLPLQEPFPREAVQTYEPLQKSGLPAAAVAAPELSGLWRRFWALLLDDLILQAMMTPVSILLACFSPFLGNIFCSQGESGDSLLLSFSVLLLVVCGIIFGSFLLQFLYSGFFLSRYAATPGKMALGIQVVRSDGSPISFLRGGSRFLAAKLSAWLLFAGYLIAVFDDQKRTLHDHLCDTRVVVRGQGTEWR